MRGYRKVNPKEVLLEDILASFEGETFGKREAAKKVGGTTKLLNLIAAGKIEVDVDPTKKNGKWACNARQVLENIRNARV